MKKQQLNWIAVCFGTCMGAGVLFLPNQIAVSGIYAFLCSLPIAFVLNFLGQRTIAKLVLKASQTSEVGWGEVIEKTFPKWGGKLLVVAFIVVMLAILSMYLLGFKNDLYAYSVEKGFLFDLNNPIFIGLIVLLFSLLLYYKQQLLYVVMKIKTTAMVLFLIVISLVLIPYWNIAPFLIIPTPLALIKGILTCLPIVIMAVNYFSIISAMVFALKENREINDVYRECEGVLKISQLLVVLVILFFVVSATLAVSPTELMSAYQGNQTVISLIKIPMIGEVGKWFALFILPATFLGAYVGLEEPLLLLLRKIKIPNVYERRALYGVMIVFIILILFSNINILSIVGILITPIIAILTYLLPAWIERKEEKHGYHWFLFIFGTLLLLAYIIAN